MKPKTNTIRIYDKDKSYIQSLSNKSGLPVAYHLSKAIEAYKQMNKRIKDADKQTDNKTVE